MRQRASEAVQKLGAGRNSWEVTIANAGVHVAETSIDKTEVVCIAEAEPLAMKNVTANIAGYLPEMVFPQQPGQKT